MSSHSVKVFSAGLFILILCENSATETKDDKIKTLSREDFTTPPFKQLQILLTFYNSTINVMNQAGFMMDNYPLEDFMERRIRPLQNEMKILATRAQEAREYCEKVKCSNKAIDAVTEELEQAMDDMDERSQNLLIDYADGGRIGIANREHLMKVVMETIEVKALVDDQLIDLYRYGVPLGPDAPEEVSKEPTIPLDATKVIELINLYKRKAKFEEQLFPLYEKMKNAKQGFGLTPDEVHEQYNPNMMGTQLADIEIKRLLEANTGMFEQIIRNLNKNFRDMTAKVTAASEVYDSHVKDMEDAFEDFQAETSRMEMEKSKLARLKMEEIEKDEL